MKYIKTFESLSNDELSTLKNMLEKMSQYGSGMQKELAKAKLNSMKVVKAKKIADAINSDVVDIIKQRVRPEKKNCYANSLHAAEFLRDYDVRYCEGWLLFHGFPIEHAFNKVGDEYFDVTEEFALDGNPEDFTYVVLKDWDPGTALMVMASGPYKCYGEVFDKEFISEHPENVK